MIAGDVAAALIGWAIGEALVIAFFVIREVRRGIAWRRKHGRR